MNIEFTPTFCYVMAFAAEESRLHDGQVVDIDAFARHAMEQD